MTLRLRRWRFSFVECSLIVRGLVLEIEHVRTDALKGNIPHEWLELAKWGKLSDEPPESFRRALVAYRDDMAGVAQKRAIDTTIFTTKECASMYLLNELVLAR